MARTEAQKRAQKKYEEKYKAKGLLKTYNLKCHIEHDKDIIEKLNAVDNKNGYIKELIRADIEKQGL